MDQLDYETSLIATTILKVIQKIITYVDFQYQKDIKKRAKKVAWYQKSISVNNFRIALQTVIAITRVTWSN